jgi:hypothetical protein
VMLYKRRADSWEEGGGVMHLWVNADELLCL